jgi:hypothetical protein
VKRSRQIRLVLIGGISAAAAAGCGPSGGQRPPLTADNVYTNDFYVPGVGYYHAPFRDWFTFPYNHFDPQRQRYFYGGQWWEAPCQSITNISSPTAQVAQQAEAQRTDIVRGGFGRTAGTYGIYG